jgi:hypothetical protein
MNETFQGTGPPWRAGRWLLARVLLVPSSAAGSHSGQRAVCSSGHADKHLFALLLPGYQGWGPVREAVTSKYWRDFGDKDREMDAFV